MLPFKYRDINMFHLFLFLIMCVQITVSENPKSETEQVDFQHRRISRLLKTSQHVAETAEEYLREEESRLSQVRNALRHFKSNQMENDKKKIQNPINAFKLIKLLSTDLKILLEETKLEAYTEDLRSMLLNGTDGQNKNYFPKERDWQNAVIELTNFHSRTIITAPSLTDRNHEDDEEKPTASELLDDGYRNLMNRRNKEADRVLTEAFLTSYYEENQRKEFERLLNAATETPNPALKTPSCVRENEVSLRLGILRSLSIAAYQKELMDDFRHRKY